jgi:uncharacterized integral membrane protein
MQERGDTMIWNTVKIAFLVAISLALALFAIQNRAPIKCHFLWFEVEMPIILPLFLAAAESFLVGLIVALFAKDRTRSKNDTKGEKYA